MPVTVVWALLPLYAVTGCFLLLWWDLRRRELALRQLQPDPETVETFSIQRLAELGAQVNELSLSVGGVLDTVHRDLEDARGERRTAQKVKAGSAPKTPQEGPAVPFEQLDRAAQLAQVEARYH